MKILSRTAGLLVLVATCSCARQQESDPHRIEIAEAQAGAPDALFASKDEVMKLKLSAMQGSGPAAARLASWYRVQPVGMDTTDYWTTIGAENGDSASQYNLAMFLLHDKPDALARERARFWLTRAASQGDPMARKYLEIHYAK
jgi:TPR repeat protein